MKRFTDSFFPNDHPVEAVRGMRMLTPEWARVVLARRAAFLQQSIEHRTRIGASRSHSIEELAALVQMMETFERVHFAEDPKGLKDTFERAASEVRRK